jgi:TRAP transporter TAXI family solute receptor
MKSKMSLLFILLFSLVVAGCGTDTAPSSSSSNPNPSTSTSEKSEGTNESKGAQTKTETKLRVGGAGTSTFVYGFMSTWSEVLKEKVPNHALIVQATPGSTSHYLMFDKAELDMGSGFTPSDQYAINGEKIFEKSSDSFRAMIPVTEARGHFIAVADSPIQSVKDLNGKKLGVGAKGSPTSLFVEDQVKALGLDVELIYSKPSELMEMIKDKRVDAGWYYTGSPWSAIVELSTQTDIKLISFSEDDLKTLKAAAPYITVRQLTSKDYEFIKEPVTVPGALQTVNVHKDVPEDIIYELTKATWESWPKMNELVKATAKVSIKDAASLVGKLHPGAYKYYKEAGVDIPDRLKP